HSCLMSYILVHLTIIVYFFFFSSRRRHTRSKRDWSSDVCSSDLRIALDAGRLGVHGDGHRRMPRFRMGRCRTLRHQGVSGEVGGALASVRPGTASRPTIWEPRSEERRVGKGGGAPAGPAPGGEQP